MVTRYAIKLIADRDRPVYQLKTFRSMTAANIFAIFQMELALDEYEIIAI